MQGEGRLMHADLHDARVHPRQVARLYLERGAAAWPFLADLDEAARRTAAAEIQFYRGVHEGTWQSLSTIEDELTHVVSPIGAATTISNR
jgi:hypothetical protein